MQLMLLAVSVLTVLAIPILLTVNNTIDEVLTVSMLLAFSIPYLLGYCGYNANTIQYGLDQLRDAPSHDSIGYFLTLVFLVLLLQYIHNTRSIFSNISLLS